MKKETFRCVICHGEFSEEELKAADANCCPSCGDRGRPCLIKDDVTVKINWHELHILCCWAERWAMRIEQKHLSSVATLDCIIQRLQKQHPEQDLLTVRGEVKKLKEQFPDATLTDENGEEIET